MGKPKHGRGQAGGRTKLATGHRARSPCASNALNNGCFCLTLDDNALARALGSEFILSELVRERWPYVLASKPVFVDALKRSA